MTEPKWWPRVFVDPDKFWWDFFSKKEGLEFIELMSMSEHEALMREARIRAFEESESVAALGCAHCEIYSEIKELLRLAKEGRA